MLFITLVCQVQVHYFTLLRICCATCCTTGYRFVVDLYVHALHHTFYLYICHCDVFCDWLLQCCNKSTTNRNPHNILRFVVDFVVHNKSNSLAISCLHCLSRLCISWQADVRWDDYSSQVTSKWRHNSQVWWWYGSFNMCIICSHTDTRLTACFPGQPG